jgi:hypothetical protein
MTILKRIGAIAVLIILFAARTHALPQPLYFYGNANNDLYQLLKREGFVIKKFATPGAAITAAPKGAGVFIIADAYPKIDPVNSITQAMLDAATKKGLRLYIEYPAAFPGLDVPGKALETNFERGVVTSNVFGAKLPSMGLLGIHNCHILPVQVANPLVVLAKVVGVDKAEYGLEKTKTWPLLFEREKALVSMTGLSNFETGRYGPEASVKIVWNYIIGRISGNKSFQLKHWRENVKPMFGRNSVLPATARLNSIKKGIEWFNKGHFFLHPDWKNFWEKYGTDGRRPVGPPLDLEEPNGDGSMGIIEGHTSTIYYTGRQQYRYWIRADVQGESGMALAASGRLLNNNDYKKRATNLVDYMFSTSNMRAGAKNDSTSAAFGLIGWATTNAGTFYGDDNARAILGAIGASAYLQTDKWDKELTEAIMANFRTTGKQGFRGERLEEHDIIRNGWPFYHNRDLLYVSPHFESWMWACYLWLYNKTGYEPLLTRTKEAIRITMESYPDKWLWGSSLQTQRARMILPLAWLVRVEDTEEHRGWLDKMINEMLKYQAPSGAFREEIGKGKGHFRELKTNDDYGTDEGSLIYQNGDPIACMIYTNNFAIFSLHEAARATGNPKYLAATNKLSDFLTRIQVSSTKHKDLDGAWFRAFDYGKWDYWASNSDAGWGAWCTLTGWIQSWIVTTQVQLQEKQSFWEVTGKSKIGTVAKTVIPQMMRAPAK